MKYPLILSAFLFSTFPTLAQIPATPSIADLLPMRSCARDLSKTIAGDRFKEGFSSEDDDSFYFLNCDENWDLGQDHYIYSPTGVYYFFIKAHKDYKGGFEGTQFRLNIENSTYYFKSNVVGGLGDLFDASGKNLDLSELNPEQMTIDPTIKNLVINYYMKTLTGKGDINSAILAEPVSGDRLIKAQSCMQKKLIKLGTSLVNVYKARRDYRQVPPEKLSEYRSFVRESLTTSGCTADPTVAESLNLLLNETRR